MTKHSFTLRDAELAYKTFGCSHFFMYREKPELHAAYQALKISREQETAWANEVFCALVANLHDASAPREDLWRMHAQATTLAESIRRIDVLRALYEVSHAILEQVPENDCIMCAENILARNFVDLRSSVVFLSATLQDPALATRFLDLAIRFAEQYRGPDRPRREQALDRAETVRAMLAG